MENLLTFDLIENVITPMSIILFKLSVLLIPSLLGVYSKHYYDTVLRGRKKKKISILGLLIIATTPTLLLLIFFDYMVNNISVEALIFAAYVGGLLGKELLGKLMTIDGVIDFFMTFTQVFKVTWVKVKNESKPEADKTDNASEES